MWLNLQSGSADVLSTDSAWINSDPTVSVTAPWEGILSARFVVSLISGLQSSPSDVVGWGRISETLQSLEQLWLSVGQHWDNFSNLPSEFKGLSPLNHGMPNHCHFVPNNGLKKCLTTILSCEVEKHPPDATICSYLTFIFKCMLFLCRLLP